MTKLIAFFKNNRKDIFSPIFVLLAICLIIPLALSLTNSVTADKIAALDAENQKKAMAGLIKAEVYKPMTAASASGEELTYYQAEKGGEIAGFLFVTAAKGYGGEVSVMTALNTDGTVLAVEILDVSNETPGLGQNAKKESFYKQYAGKKAGISLLKNGADEQKNEINAVTGATITSKAVTAAVNQALADFEAVSAAAGEGDKAE